MTNGQLILVVGGAALGGLLVGGVIAGAKQRPGVDLALQADPLPRKRAARRDPAAVAPAPRRGATAPSKRRPARREPPRRPSPDVRHAVKVDPGDPTRGPASARVTIVAFTNFQCGYCARAAATIDQVHRAYGDDVRIVLKHHPFATQAEAQLAHQAAAEAQAQGKFWEYHDRLFASRALKRPDLEAHAEALGLDMARFRQALDGQVHAAQVQRHVAQARSLGATGTPAFFVNGRFVSGARPFEAFKTLIDAELGR